MTRQQNLVLCQDDYDIAYHEQSGPARSTLYSLLQQSNPCVFIGSSIEDVDLLEAIRYTSGARRQSQTLGGRHAELYSPDPPWFAFLPARLDDNNRVDASTISNFAQTEDERLRFQEFIAEANKQQLSRLVREKTRFFLAKGIRTIWYVPDQSYSQLPTLLRALRDSGRPQVQIPEEPVFLLRAEELDRLCSLDEPSFQDQQRALELIRTLPECRAYFFQHVKGLGWFEILDSAGLLRRIDEPVPDGAGNVVNPYWEAAPFVEYIAEHEPQRVAQLIPEIETDNWHVLTVLSTILLQLPLDVVLSLVPRTFLWLRSPYARKSAVEHNLVRLLVRLSGATVEHEAMDLLGELLGPKVDEQGRLELQLSDLELVDIVACAERIAVLDPYPVVALFQHLLNSAVVAEFGESAISWSGWRDTVEDRQDALSLHSTLDFLVSCIRIAAISLARRGAIEGIAVIKSWLDGNSAILRRVALFAVAEVPELVKPLEPSLFPSQSIFATDAFHEQMLVLHRQFHLLSREEQNRLRRLLRRGPRAAEATEPANMADQRRDFWRWRILSVLPQSALTKADRAWLASQGQQRDELENPFELNPSRAVMLTSPASMNDLRTILRQEGIPGLLAVLRAPQLRFQITWFTRTDILWEITKGLVLENPHELINLASALTVDDIESGGAWQYLEAYAELVRSGVTFNWQPLVQLATTLTSSVLPNGGVITSHQWATSLCRLMRDGVTGTTEIPPELLSDVTDTLVRMVDLFEARLDESISDKGYYDSVIPRYLNHPGGIAADALLLLLWRYLDLRDREKLGAAAQIGPVILNLLDNAIRDAWGGIDMRHAIGYHLIIIERAHPGCVRLRLDRLFPQGTTLVELNAGRAFWQGYLSSRHGVFSELLLTLRSEYSRVLSDLMGSDATYLMSEQLSASFLKSATLLA